MRIKPRFSTEDETQSQFEDEVSNIDYEKAISICRRPRDQHGHSETIGFRVNPMYTRLGGELLTREPAFKLHSDLYRTALRLGFQVILNTLKEKGKIGDELDDMLTTLDGLDKTAKSDEVYRRMGDVINGIQRSLNVYKGNPVILKKKLSDFEERIKKLKDSFWRERLMKKFKLMVKNLQNGDDDFSEGGEQDEL